MRETWRNPCKCSKSLPQAQADFRKKIYTWTLQIKGIWQSRVSINWTYPLCVSAAVQKPSLAYKNHTWSPIFSTHMVRVTLHQYHSSHPCPFSRLLFSMSSPSWTFCLSVSPKGTSPQTLASSKCVVMEHFIIPHTHLWREEEIDGDQLASLCHT